MTYLLTTWNQEMLAHLKKVLVQFLTWLKNRKTQRSASFTCNQPSACSWWGIVCLVLAFVYILFICIWAFVWQNHPISVTGWSNCVPACFRWRAHFGRCKEELNLNIIRIHITYWRKTHLRKKDFESKQMLWRWKQLFLASQEWDHETFTENWEGFCCLLWISSLMLGFLVHLEATIIKELHFALITIF